jgi:hypothetical protein
MTSALEVLNSRDGELTDARYAYKLAGGQFAMAVGSDAGLEIDAKVMALWIPIADGNRRDGVGDLLEVEGIKTERHRRNAITLFDHGKNVQLPIGMAYERDEQGRYDRTKYTFTADPVSRTAGMKTFFWQGQFDIPNVDKAKQYDHATFCQQLFKMCDDGLLGAGSIGYQVIHAKNLQPDYDRGTPPGLHLLSILMLEGSLVVLPANGDTVRKMLSFPTVCGKPLSPYFVKSLTPYAAPKKAQMGYEGNKAQHGGRGSGKVPERFDRTTDPFMLGGRVVAREMLFDFPPGGKPELFLKAGERGTVVDVDQGFLWVENAAGKTSKQAKASFRKGIDMAHKSEDQSRDSDGKFGSGGGGDSKPKDDGPSYEEAHRGMSRHRPGPKRKPMTASGDSTDAYRQAGYKKLRMKYRKSAKGLVRRLKKSSPGKAMIYVWGKDIGEAEKMAKAKGLKFQRQGYHVSGAEKVKLMGDDSSIDEVAKHFGQPFRSGVKTKSLNGANNVAKKELKREVKAAPEGMGGGDPRDLNGDGVVSQVEKWGAQMMRHAHDHFSTGMKTYDEMLNVLEDEDVKNHFTGHLGNMEKFLSDNEALWEKKYGSGSEHNYPPLAGMEDKDLTEDEAEDISDDIVDEEEDTEADDAADEIVDDLDDADDKDMDTMDDAAVPADSGGDELADPDEAVEGMEEDVKSLRAKYRKGGLKAAPLKAKKKSACPCGKPNCDCGKKDKMGPAVAAAIPAIAGALSGGEKGYVKEAGGFLGEVAQPNSPWEEEHRFKAYHYHKTLEGIGDLEEANDDLNQTPPESDIPPAEFEPGVGAKGFNENQSRDDDGKFGSGGGGGAKKPKGSGKKKPAKVSKPKGPPKEGDWVGFYDSDGQIRKAKVQSIGSGRDGPTVRVEGVSGHINVPMQDLQDVKSMPGDPDWELEEAQEPEHQTKGHRKMCKDASGFLGGLSRQTAIDDNHRQQAGVFAKQMEEMAGGDEPPADPTAEDNGVVMEEGAEDPEPGEIRESSLKMIAAEKKALIETQRQMAELNRSLLLLVGQ